MRLWHEALLPDLPRQQLLGQHREVCALRGNGWNKKHQTVDYVFHYSPFKLYQYHLLVINEMLRRGYRPDLIWENPLYRGKNQLPYSSLEEVPLTKPIYPEHDLSYLKECIQNLAGKGFFLSVDLNNEKLF